ncbi:tetratricopeptide repeat protein [mine drainage metagenome]|uniref:Tetratricopeptide repeat protein n=1 Tax=mine drainage metagenome TaxID=410659 RepID=A0A1J5RIF4_9ZZZZ
MEENELKTHKINQKNNTLLSTSDLCAQGLREKQSGNLQKAISLYSQAISTAPQDPAPQIFLGVALEAQGRYTEAAACARQAIALGADQPHVWRNLGITLQKAGRIDEAIAALRTALLKDPAALDSSIALGAALLLDGRMEEGWHHYGKYRAQPGYKAFHGFSGRFWRGQPLDGGALEIFAEQGLGDTLQFCRFLPPLLARDDPQAAPRRVRFRVQPELAALFQASFPAIAVEPRTLPAAAAPGWQCPLLALPGLERMALDRLPAPPYLHPPEAALRRWRQALPPAPGQKRLGLVWGGNPRNPTDSLRSIPLEALAAALAGLEGWQVCCLQPGGGAAFHQAFPHGLDPSAAFSDFAETAACIAQLDACVAVDTAVAHLAGAMGKPLYLLLPFAPDWRWQRQRADSPWYPSATLIRQPAPGDWSGALAELRCRLRTD